MIPNPSRLLDRPGRASALVFGDMILDRYIEGTSSRLAPDGPVPVVVVDEEADFLGGAANVALNLARCGFHAIAVGFAGNDANGEYLRNLLRDHNIEDKLVPIAGWRTITKTRLRCGGETLLRVDHEQVLAGEAARCDSVVSSLKDAISRNPRAVVISDYGKGAVEPETCKALIRAAHDSRIVVLVDPAGSDWERYRGAYGICPNEYELGLASGENSQDLDALVNAAQRLRSRLAIGFVLIKRAQQGMTLVTHEAIQSFPALATVVRDVSGAGDTVIALVAWGLSAGLPLGHAVWLASAAAADVVAKRGTVPVDIEDLRARLNGASFSPPIPEGLMRFRGEE